MFARLAASFVHHPWRVLAFVSVATLLAAGVAPTIRFDFTPQAILRGNEELTRAADEFNQTFGFEEASLLLVLEATSEGDVLTAPPLDWLARITAGLEAFPEIQSVESLANVKVVRWQLRGLSAEQLLTATPVDDAEASRARAALERSPLVTGALVSQDRKLALITAALAPAAHDIDSMRSVTGRVENLLASQPPPAGFAAHLSGLPSLRVDIVRALVADQKLLLPLAALVQLAMLLYLFRSIAGTLVPIAAVCVGLAWTTATLAATGQSFNVVSNILPVLLMIVGIAHCVHVVSRYSEEFWECGGGREERIEAARRTMAHMAVACLLTFTTNAIGFLSLFSAQSELLRALGWQASLGMVMLYAGIVTVMSAVLPFFVPPRHHQDEAHAATPIARLLAFLGDQIARRPWPALAASSLCVAAALWYGSGVVVNSHMVETFDPTHPTLRAMQLVEQGLGGFIPLEISLKADRPGRFAEPDTFARVAAAQQFAAEQKREQQPDVLFARSYVDLFREIQRRRTRATTEDHGASRLSDPRQLALVADLADEVGDEMQYERFVDESRTRARIMLRTADIGTRETLELTRRLEAKLAELFPPGCGVTASLTGVAYVNALSMDRLIRDLFTSLWWASLSIFALVTIFFASLRIGVIAAIPNLTPLAVTLGYMRLRGYDMNVGNVIIFTISVGLAVDDTIHFLSRFQEEMRHANGNMHEAMHATFLGTGRAVVLTSLMLIAGLSVLLFSSFVPTRRFAELTAVTIAAALVAEIVLLPACLAIFWKRPAAQAGPSDAEPAPARASA
jgi:hydrophobe/amphiphile efflux-3 (HAE3) family protein